MADEFFEMLPTPIGLLLLRARNNRLAGIEIRAISAPVATELPGEAGKSSPSGEVLSQAKCQLGEYFAGCRKTFDLPLDLSDVPLFTRRVLEVLRNVPYGVTLTYGELAARAGSPRASRAVGQAMATNPLPIVIPCHRIVGADGRLGGYSGGEGVRSKEWLLAFERSNN